MTNSSPMYIPGAFNVAQHRENSLAPRLSGAKSHIFRPPRTRTDSASSSMMLSRSTASLMSTTTTPTYAGRHSANSTRKRSRTEAETPPAARGDWSSTMVDSTEAAGADICPGSPTPLANSKYVLAGGMDTPTMRAAQLALAGESDYSDMAYRRSLGADRQHQLRPADSDLYSEMDASGYFPNEGSGRDANGRGRQWNSPGGQGWSKTAINVAGAVVGKVWEFCKNGGAVFRGFQAGGGKGYTVDNTEPTTPRPAEEGAYWKGEESSTWGPADRESTPLPGRFPVEEIIPDYLDFPKQDMADRPAKRRQVSRNNTADEIAKNWVVVQPTPPPATHSKPQPRPASRLSRPTASSASRRSAAVAARPASRAGYAAATSPRKIASRASTVSVSHAGSPALLSNRGASFASPRASPSSKIPRPSPMKDSSTMISTRGQDSPAAKEAKRWAVQKKKEERDADESISRLDAQLKAMIREGKEALGTKIEVEMEDDIDLSD